MKANVLASKLLLIILITFHCISLFSQLPSDSATFYFSTVGNVSSKKYQPFYHVFNQHGTINDERGNLLIDLGIDYHKRFRGIELNIGIEGIGDIYHQELFTQQYYLNLSFKKFHFLAGAKKQYSSHQEFSGLTWGVSDNARPIPGLKFYSDFIDVPLTNSFLSFRGGISHSWLSGERFVKNAWLHEKFLQARIGRKNALVNFFGAFRHYVIWSGVHPDPDFGDQPSGFNDFIRVFLGQGGEESASLNTGDISNALGSHSGFFDWDLEISLKDYYLRASLELPFEDNKSLKKDNFYSPDDYNLTFAWASKVDRWLSNLSFSIINTKDQGGAGLPDPAGDIITIEDNFGNEFGGRDDYYNNFFYSSGWSYRRFSIGNPLLLTRDRFSKFSDAALPHDVFFVNNRLAAYTIALGGNTSLFQYELTGTYTKNFGTYAGLYEGRFNWDGIIDDPDFDYFFLPPQKQFYLLFDTEIYPFQKSEWSFGLSIAYDFGDMYHVFGAGFSINYQLTMLGY